MNDNFIWYPEEKNDILFWWLRWELRRKITNQFFWHDKNYLHIGFAIMGCYNLHSWWRFDFDYLNPIAKICYWFENRIWWIGFIWSIFPFREFGLVCDRVRWVLLKYKCTTACGKLQVAYPSLYYTQMKHIL